MAFHLKHILKLRPQFYSYRRIASNVVNEQTKALSAKEYEILWHKTQKKLESTDEKVNFEEFKVVIDGLNTFINDWINSTSKLQAKKIPFNNLLENIFADHNSLISKKFVNNCTNWSILYENVSDLSLKISNTTYILNRENQNLNDLMDLRLFEIINKFERDLENFDENSKSLSMSNDKLNQYKFYVYLGLSLYKYLIKMDKISKNEETLTIFLIKGFISYAQALLYSSKSSLSYIIKNENASGNEILEFLSKIEPFIKKLMKKYDSFSSIPDLKKPDYLYFFSFYETKWKKTANWLLDPNQKQFRILNFSVFLHALGGAIKFENHEYFEKLCASLYELTVSYNNSSVLLSYIFRDFMTCIKTISNMEERLNIMLKVWSNVNYVPTRIGRQNFEIFLANLNSKDSWYDIVPVKVNLRGEVLDSKYVLDKAYYNPEKLKELANCFKSQILSQTNFKNEKLVAFKKIDDLTMKINFDFIMDGMNIAYVRYGADRLKLLKVFIKSFNMSFKNKKILIVLRDHLYIKHKNELEEIMKFNHLENSSKNHIHFHCLDSVYEDDKFILYAALNSSNMPLIMSRDNFSNHAISLKEYTDLYRQWLFNKKIAFTYNKEYKFFMPPMYKVKCKQLGENKWIIPYFKDTNESTHFQEHGFIKIEKKYFGNKNQF